MQAMVEERRVVCWRDVLQLMYTPGLPEGKKLILRPRLFELVAGPQILSVVDEKEDVLDVVKIFGGEGPALMLRLSGRVMRSSLQKVIRFHAKDVLVEGKLIPAPVVAAASAALLFASKGGFSPELQLFTRGATAAFKRLAVILLEDAWIEEDNMASSLEGLLALGLVTQQMNDYEPSHHLIISSMRIAAKAAMSCSLIAWRKGKQGPSSIKVLECEARSFQTSAQLLRDLRSFAGDMQMFDQVSETLLRQQYACISMPTPSLQGGLVSDQLAAYDGDWKVYRLLALISRLVPAALRPTMPPNFQVVNSILLRVVEKWMMEGIQSRPADLHLPRSVGLETVGRWEEVQKCLEQVAELMEHQREAIHCMVQRDEDLKCGGHFLIMDTGHGKTVTALVYAFRWLCQHGQNVKRLVWITPHGTVENLVKQLRDTWRVKTHVVPRISSAKKPKSGERYDLVLKDFMVNVIHADHLRAAIDKGLAAEERGKMTLSKKHIEFSRPQRHPVLMSIAAREEDVLVPMVDDVRDHCRRIFNSRGAARWLEMAGLVQQHTDAAMIKVAVQAAEEDSLVVFVQFPKLVLSVRTAPGMQMAVFC
eukprot:g7051.t1